MSVKIQKEYNMKSEKLPTLKKINSFKFKIKYNNNYKWMK